MDYQNDSDLVHGLLEVKVEGTLGRSSWIEKDCSQFDNDRVTLLLQPKPRNPIGMMHNGSCSIVDQKFLCEQYELKFKEREGEGVLDRNVLRRIYSITQFVLLEYGALRAFLFDCIENPNELGFPYLERSFWSKRIIYDEEDRLQENGSEFLQNGTMEYQTRDRSSKEQDFF